MLVYCQAFLSHLCKILLYTDRKCWYVLHKTGWWRDTKSNTLQAKGTILPYRITQPRKNDFPRKYKISFSGWKWEILSWIKQIFSKSIFLRFFSFNYFVSKSTNIKSMRKGNFEETCFWKLWHFSFNFHGSILLPWNCI